MAAQGPARATVERGERQIALDGSEMSAGTRDDWETPWPLFRLLDREFNFTLDAAASERNRKCERWLEGPCIKGADHPALWPTDPCLCGLCSDWMEHSVWCNPPYGAGIERWVHKFIHASVEGASVVALLPANTDTEWFAACWKQADEVRLLSGRVNFVGSSSGNTGGSAILVFRPFGFIRLRIKPHHPKVLLWDWRAEVGG